MDLSIPKAILVAMWRRRATGNVNVAYLIEAARCDTAAKRQAACSGNAGGSGLRHGRRPCPQPPQAPVSVPWAPGQLWPAQGIAERISKQDINTVTGQAGSLQSLGLRV